MTTVQPDDPLDGPGPDERGAAGYTFTLPAAWTAALAADALARLAVELRRASVVARHTPAGDYTVTGLGEPPLDLLLLLPPSTPVHRLT